MERAVSERHPSPCGNREAKKGAERGEGRREGRTEMTTGRRTEKRRHERDNFPSIFLPQVYFW